MRHRLDLINLQKPKIRLPAMGFEQRVMIRTEMSRCPLPVSGGVEHAAEAGRVDRPAVYTEADQGRWCTDPASRRATVGALAIVTAEGA